MLPRLVLDRLFLLWRQVIRSQAVYRRESTETISKAGRQRVCSILFSQQKEVFVAT